MLENGGQEVRALGGQDVSGGGEHHIIITSSHHITYHIIITLIKNTYSAKSYCNSNITLMNEGEGRAAVLSSVFSPMTMSRSWLKISMP